MATTTLDPDEEAPEKPLRWAYSTGSGQVCWYCDRVFKTEEPHKWDSRAAYEHALVTNMEVLNHHHTRRHAFLQRRREGHKYVERMPGPAVAAVEAAPPAPAPAPWPAPAPVPSGPQMC